MHFGKKLMNTNKELEITTNFKAVMRPIFIRNGYTVIMI